MGTTPRQYDPNEYTFGNFAETMNNNTAIDMAQNSQGGTFGANGQSIPAQVPNAVGVEGTGAGNLNGTTNSQTLGNSGGEMTFGSVVEGFNNVLQGASEGQSVPYSGSVSTSEVNPAAAPAATPEGTITEGTESVTPEEGTESVTPGPLDWITSEEASWMDDGTTDTEGTGTNTGTEGTEGTTVGTEGTVTGTVTGSGEIEYDKEETLGYAEWESTYSVNAETEYRNAQAQLDYEFQTWMSTYGARAEELFQMGLSNSGVSDIYGLGAYTAYIQASMDLKRSKIELDKRNKQEYQKYVDNIASRNKAAQEAIKSKIGSAFASYADTYTPADEAKVRAALTAQGYSESEVSQVINKLNQYYNSTPEEDRPDVIESNAKVSEGYNMYLANYKPENSQNIYNELVEVHGLTKQEAMKVIKKLQASYEANAPARFEADVQNALTWLRDNYVYGMTEDQLKGLLGSDYSEDVIAAAFEKFASYKTAVDSIGDNKAAQDAFAFMYKLVQDGDLDIESLKAKAKATGEYNEAAINLAAENIQIFVDEAAEKKAETNAENAKTLILGQINAGVTDVDELIAAAMLLYDEKAVETALASFGVTKVVGEDGSVTWKVDENGYLGIQQGKQAAAEEEANAKEFEGAVSSAYGNIIELYSNKTATTEADLRALLKNANSNYSDEVIDEAISRFNSIKHIIDDKAFKTDTKNAVSLIMDAYIKGETDITYLQMIAEQQYGKDAALEAMNQLGYFFIAGYNKTVEANTKLAFNLMLETMQNYNVTDLATLQSLAAGLYGSDAAAAALEQIKPFAELNAEQLDNANVNLGMKMMQDMMAAGETDIEKLKDIVAAWYGDDVANAAAERLAPLAELGAAEQKEATIQSALAWMIDAYNDGVTDRVTLEKQAAAIFGDETIAKEASKLFEPFREWGDKVSTEAKVQSALEWMIGSGETDLDKLEKQVAAIFGDETIAAEAMKRYEPIASGDVDQMIYDAATMFGYNSDGEFSYTGSESDKNFIERMLNTTAYSMYKPYTKEIIAQLDADLAGMKGAEAGDVGDAFGSITENESWLSDPATSTMANYSATLEQYKQKYGVNSQEYKDVLAAGSASIKDYILKATDDVDMLDQAGSWLGIDFADMDDADKINAMLEGAGELYKSGHLVEDDYAQVLNTWLDTQLANSSSESKSFLDLAQKLEKLDEFYEDYGFSDSVYNSMKSEILEMAKVNSVEYKYSDVTKTSSVVISGEASGNSFSVKCSISKMSINERDYLTVAAGDKTIFEADGNIYYKANNGLNYYMITGYMFSGAAENKAGGGKELEIDFLLMLLNIK